MSQKPALTQITEGVIWKQLLQFFFPILLGTFFQQMYNTVDTIIVGRAVGTQALAAVGATAALINLINGFFIGLTSEDAALPEIERGEPLAVIYPEDGTIAVPDGVALIKNAPHSQAAKDFIDFVLGQDVQNLVSRRWYRRSVRHDVPLPVGAEPFDSIHILPYDIFTAAQQRTTILRRWRDL